MVTNPRARPPFCRLNLLLRPPPYVSLPTVPSCNARAISSPPPGATGSANRRGGIAKILECGSVDWPPGGRKRRRRDARALRDPKAMRARARAHRKSDPRDDSCEILSRREISRMRAARDRQNSIRDFSRSDSTIRGYASWRFARPPGRSAKRRACKRKSLVRQPY